MNRSRYIPRSGDAGTQAALAAAHALGQVADSELIDSFRRHVEAVDEFGGEIYVGGDRRKVSDGRVVEHNDPEGSWTTLGYVVGYHHKARFQRAEVEADVPYEQAEAPELEPAPGPETLRDEIEAEVEDLEQEAAA